MARQYEKATTKHCTKTAKLAVANLFTSLPSLLLSACATLPVTVLVSLLPCVPYALLSEQRCALLRSLVLILSSALTLFSPLVSCQRVGIVPLSSRMHFILPIVGTS